MADKIVATFQRYGTQGRPSTRYRDLVDLVAIVSAAAVGAHDQLAAVTSEFARRRITVPTAFRVPDRALWERGYAAEARRSLLSTGLTLDAALAIVRPFVDPLLGGHASGAWDPQLGHWTD